MFNILRSDFLGFILGDNSVNAPLHPLSLRLLGLHQLLARSVPQNHPNYKRIELDISELQRKVTALLDGSHARDMRHLELQAIGKAFDRTNELLEQGISPDTDRALRRGIIKKSTKLLLKSGNMKYDEEYLSRSIDTLEREVKQLVGRIDRSTKIAQKTDVSSTGICVNAPHQELDGVVEVYNKLSRIRARVQTLSGRNLEKSQDELCKLFRDVLYAEIPSGSEADKLREEIFLDISVIFERESTKSNKMRTGYNRYDIQSITGDGPIQDTSQEVPNIPIGNQEFLKYITSISGLLTHKESSEKKGESVGDGNFIKHVWNPFLTYLEAYCKSNYVDFNNFSWKELVGKIYSENEGIRGMKRRANFLDILSQNEDIGDWKTNWQYVILAIGEHASIDGFYKSGKWVKPLANVTDKLKNNPPPSR